MMRRILYLGYYLNELDIKKLIKFLEFANQQTGISKYRILLDLVVSTFQYNISILDYFYFRFYNQSKAERNTWAGTGYMYEYQRVMNPIHAREVLANKVLFLSKLKPFIKRDFNTYKEIIQDPTIIKKWMKSNTGKVVVKNSRGQVGAEVEVLAIKDFTPDSLLSYMLRNSFDLIEEFVVQHDHLMQLSPTGLNTVRVITQLENGEVHILGARLRISINSFVDNLAAGNVAAPIDINSGKVIGAGVYSDITKMPEEVHPITNQTIIGFEIPYWIEVIALVKEAALLISENKSVGWDIAITNHGPILIEGNHNWCKLLWQLPVNEGLKHKLEQFKS